MRRLFLIFWLAVAAANMAFAQDDEGDRGYIAGLLENALGGEGRVVRIVGFTGALSSTARVEQITIADPQGVWLTLNNVEMSWNRSRLLGGAIDIDTLKAETILLPRLPAAQPGEAPSAEAQGFALPELPVSVRVGELGADRIEIGAPVLGQAVVLKLATSLALVSGEGDVALTAERIDDTQGTIVLTGRFANETGALDLNLKVVEGADGFATTLLGIPDAPPASLDLVASGSLADLTGRLDLRTDDQPRVAGDLTIVTQDNGDRQFNADLGGDVSALLQGPFQPFFGPQSSLQAQGVLSADGTVDLSSLTMDTAALDLNGAATLNADGWPMRLDVTGRLANADGTPVRLPVAGDPVTVGSADFVLQFDADQGDAWTGRFDVQDPRGGTLAFDQLLLLGGGTVDADAGGVGAFSADLDLTTRGFAPQDPDLLTAIGAAFGGRLSLTYAPDAPLDLTRIDLQADGLSVQGTAQIADLSNALRTQFDITAAVADFNRFSGISGQNLDGSGDLEINGFADLGGVFDVKLEAETRDLSIGQAQADAILAGGGAITLDALRDATGLTLRALDVRTDQASVSGAGTLASEAADLQLEARLNDVALIAPGYAGPATAQGTAQLSPAGWLAQGRITGPYGVNGSAEANLRAAQPVVAFDLVVPETADLGSPYAGPATVQGRAVQSASGWQVDTTIGGPLGVTGRVTADIFETIAAQFDLKLPDAADVGSPYAGEVTAIGQVLQTDTGWQVDTDVTGPLGVAGRTAVTLADGITAQFNLRLPDAADVGSPYAGAVTANGTATQTDEGWQVDTALTGPAQLTADVRAVLADRATVDYSARLPNVGALNLPFSGALTATGQARQQEQGWQVTTSIDGPEGLTGSAQADLAEAISVQYALSLPDAASVGAPFSGPLSVTGTAEQSGDTWRTDTRLSGPAGTEADLSGQVAPQINLTATGQLPLGLLNEVVSPRSLQGTARFDLLATGAALDAVSGRITISDGVVASPTDRLSLSGIAGDVTLANGRALVSIAGSGSAGGGLTVDGPITLSGSYPADLRIQLARLALSDPQLYRTTVSGNVALTGALTGGGLISGDLALGETVVSIPSTFVGALSDIPDIRHIGATRPVLRTLSRAHIGTDSDESGSSGARARPFGLNLTIDAPSRVFVRGRGLDAEMGGTLGLTGTTANIVSSGGADLIRGRLDILGRRFVLDEGSVQLLGDFDPYIEFIASTDTDAGTASITIEGRASSPDVTFSAVPDVPQDEVLAQLLFGRDLSTLSAFQALELASAVATLAGRGGVGIVARLRDGFGLDDLDVTSDDDGNAQLKAGKYISDNIYTDVTVGQDAQPEVSLNIDLTPNVTARGTLGSDGDTSLGVFFEKDY